MPRVLPAPTTQGSAFCPSAFCMQPPAPAPLALWLKAVSCAQPLPQKRQPTRHPSNRSADHIKGMPRTVVRRPWWPLVPLLTLAAEDAAPSKLSFFGSSKDAAAEPAAPSKLSFFGSASAGDARRQEDGQDSKRAAAAAADAPKRPFFGSSSAKQAREQEEPEGLFASLGEKRGEKSGLITVDNFVVGSSRQTTEMI